MGLVEGDKIKTAAYSAPIVSWEFAAAVSAVDKVKR
jgi:hypothetical protein